MALQLTSPTAAVPKLRQLGAAFLLYSMLVAGAHGGGFGAAALFKAGVEVLAGEAVQAARSDRRASVRPLLGDVGFEHCADLFPKDAVLDTGRFDKRWAVVELCSESFAVAYSRLSKTPLVVVERLDATSLSRASDQQRPDRDGGEAFFADPRVRQQAAAGLEDYEHSGYDRGHIASAADQPSENAMLQSFALTNVVPQAPKNNRRGAWLKLERDTRRFVRRARGVVFVYSGPLFESAPKTIGRSQVWVPSHLFKVVYDSSSGRSWAHVVENSNDAVLGPPLTYGAFVERTGLRVLPAARDLK